MFKRLRSSGLLGPASVLLALIITTVLLVLLVVYEDKQNDKVRAEVRIAFCEEFELLKKGFRDEAKEDYKNLDQTLKLLKIERTPEIERVALDNKNEVLTTYAPIKGGCKKYGNVNSIIE